jgi:phosphoribosylamine--glycine ligase
MRRTILQPVVDGMARRGSPYVGVLYAGLMLTPDGPKALEFNCRFGDPETQAILPLLDCDLYEALAACAGGCLDQAEIVWRDGSSAVVVVAAGGYPGEYQTGLLIEGLEHAASLPDVTVFHAGTEARGEQVVTAGGRVMGVSAVGETLAGALSRAYAAIEHIHFDGMHFRRDIGRSGVNQ